VVTFAVTSGMTYEVSADVRSVNGVSCSLGVSIWNDGNGAAFAAWSSGWITSSTFVRQTLRMKSLDDNPLLMNITVGVNNEGTGIFEADNISVKELPGNHGKQSTAAARPLLIGPPSEIDYDAVDDAVVVTFASSLGSTCTVARAVQGVGASILTNQTIGTTYTDNTDHCGLIIIDRALTTQETADVTTYLNTKAGV